MSGKIDVRVRRVYLEEHINCAAIGGLIIGLMGGFIFGMWMFL